MLTRSMAWFAVCMLLLAAVVPTRAAAPRHTTSAPLTNRVYIPIGSANLTRPDTVRVQSDRRYATSDAMVVVGEVINIGSAPVYGVEVEATFFDAAGDILGTTNDYALFEQTKPDQRTPFRLLFTDAPAQVVRHEVRVVNWSTTSPFNPQPLVVVAQRTRNNEGLEVFGEVRNTSASTLGDNVVVTTLYDANGKVVDVIPAPTGRTELAPGSTTVYTAHAVQTTAYSTPRVQGEGFVIDRPAAAWTLRIPNWRPFDDMTTTGTTRIIVGEAINDASAMVYDVELEARYYDASNQLVAVATSDGDSARTGLGQMKSGQRNPFEIALADAPNTIARAEITATAYGTGLADYRSIMVVGDDDQQAPDGTEVVGRVRNNEPVTLERAYVAVTYYDAAGRVADVAFGEVNIDDAGNGQPLGAGAEANYVAFNGRSVTYTRYVVQAEGYAARNPLLQRTLVRFQHSH